MRPQSFVVCFCAVILLTVASIGCGSGSSSLPETVINSTANPLVAKYTILTPHAGSSAWVEFGLDTTYGRQTSIISNSGTNSAAQPLYVLVAGMLPQTTYHMRAHVNWPAGAWVDDDQTFTTGAIPSSVVSPQVSVAAPGNGFGPASLAPAPGVELLSLIPTGNPNLIPAVATDLQGNVIWYCPITPEPIKLLPNGHFIVLTGENLMEIDLTCNTIRSISTAQVNQSLQAQGLSFNLLSFSHDVLVLPNGHWFTILQISQDFTDLPGYPGTTAVLGDLLVDIDPGGNVVWNWSAFNYLDVNRHLQGLPDWTHSNALVYTSDGNILLSMRNQSWILKIQYLNGHGSGNILWTLGNDGDFTLLGGDPSQWFYGQHNPNVLSTNGLQTTLTIFDDGNLRMYSDGVACGSTPSAPACYTRATIFQIDESTNLATLLWQDLPGFYTFWGGSIGVLSNGDVEFCASDPFNTASSVITETTQTESPQTVWQMTVNGGNAYRGTRIPSLYPGVTWTQ
jgi:arylsulfate sulfotransferase